MRKLVVGLIGQVCAGKSTVAAAFRRRGAALFDADQAVHALYARPEVAAQVRGVCGEGVLDEQGGVDRKALARLVFSDPAQLQRLTGEVVFPLVRESVQGALAQFRAAAAPVLLLDAPTLVEAGMAGSCDQVLFVSAPLSRRLKWAHARGWEPGELERRERCLLDEARKRPAATVIIHNDGSRQDLQTRVDQLLSAWSSAGSKRRAAGKQ